MANFDAPQSRNEAILQNMLGANNEIGEPQSRIEALLIQILETGGGGGGGGTTNYNLLQNKPQIGGVTLQGDKSLADLGIMEVDDHLSPTSENAVQNKLVTLALNDKLGIVSTMPAADASYHGKQRLYIGSTTEYYTKGMIYECQTVAGVTPTAYHWVQISASQIIVDDELSTTSEHPVQNKIVTLALNDKLGIVSTMPTASATYEDQQRLYIGATNANYTKGNIYECQEDSGVYSWVVINKADIEIDSALSTTSENPLQNKVVTQELNKRLIITNIMPTASDSNAGEQRLYIGATNLNYTKGNIYECQEVVSDTYAWVIINKADIPIDNALSITSENPVQNKVVTEELEIKLSMVTTMATASADLLDEDVLFVGTSTADYAKGMIYECQQVPESDPAEYEWVPINSVPIEIDDVLSTTSEHPVENRVITDALNKRLVAATSMPTASSTYENQQRIYIGTTTADYTKGTIYECQQVPESDPAEYEWVVINNSAIAVDTELSDTSEKPVENRAITIGLQAKVDKLISLDNTKDLNDITTSGFYCAQNAAHSPYTNAMVLVYGYADTNNCFQLAIDAATGNQSKRSKISGTWGAWQAMNYICWS